MISITNVIDVFKKHGLNPGFKHLSRSISNLALFVLEAWARMLSKAFRRRAQGRDRYLKMQKSEYNLMARRWSPTNRDPVVGWWDEHNNFSDYEKFLFRGLNTQNLVALEYGCGPGRNIERFWSRFRRIDGVDISKVNIRKATKFLANVGITSSNLWTNDGVSIKTPSLYDVVFSVITLQHIASHEVRFSILQQMYIALRAGGTLSFQMGLGPRIDSVDYFENSYDVNSTNGGCDVRVESPSQIFGDLEKIGFVNLQYELGQPCHDLHEQWIWVMANKP